MMKSTIYNLYKTFKSKRALAILVCLVHMFSLSAQTPRQDSGAKGLSRLSVGNYVTDDFWNREHVILHNGTLIKQTLKKFQGKPLILDFWATWCGSCIQKFKILDSLQNKYDQKLNILLVNSLMTKDTQVSISTHWNDAVRDMPLPTVLYDTFLTGLFPPYARPQYVWIDKEGRVMAISSSEFLNDGLIKSIVEK